MLNSYIAQVQDLLHDTSGSFYSTSKITGYINQARQRTAADSECIRVLPPSTAGIASYTVVNGGTGYTAATVTVGAPQTTGGVQATATATVGGGLVTAVNVVLAGSGYVVPPTVTISGDGSGAVVTANLQPAVQTVANQEIYLFSAFNSFVQQTPGVASILAVRQIAVYWGNLKPALAYCPWTQFNAYYRAYNLGLTNFPSVFSQFGQGQSGSVYLWPIPSQTLGMDWDCTCVPINLVSDATVEAIPDPFTEAVPFRAAYLAYLNAQRYDDAQLMEGMYFQKLRSARANSSRSMQANYYWFG